MCKILAKGSFVFNAKNTGDQKTMNYNQKTNTVNEI